MTLLVQNVGPRFAQEVAVAPAPKVVAHQTAIPGVTVLARPDQETAVSRGMALLAKLGDTPAGKLAQQLIAKRTPVINVAHLDSDAGAGAVVAHKPINAIA